MNLSFFVPAVSIFAVLTFTLVTTNLYASDINCNEEPDHELCNGEEGRQGMNYCEPRDEDKPYGGDCYSRDYSQIDCDEIPTHSRCVGSDGLNGLMFCDKDPDADPCYDR
jgi:hypothetical protein